MAQVFSTYESRHDAGDPKPFERGINSFSVDERRPSLVDCHHPLARRDFWQQPDPQGEFLQGVN